MIKMENKKNELNIAVNNKNKSSNKLREVLKSIDNGEPYEDEFPYEVYETMDTAAEQFSKIDFADKILFVFQLMSSGRNKTDALVDLERDIDSTIDSYRRVIKTTENNEKNLLKHMETLETNKKAFMDFLNSLEVVCFALTH